MDSSFVLTQKNQKVKTGNSAKILNKFLKNPNLLPTHFQHQLQTVDFS